MRWHRETHPQGRVSAPMDPLLPVTVQIANVRLVGTPAVASLIHRSRRRGVEPRASRLSLLWRQLALAKQLSVVVASSGPMATEPIRTTKSLSVSLSAL
jgi:hypothetical protein